MSQKAADLMSDEIRNKPDLLLCTATGATPTTAYDMLAAKKSEELNLFDKLRIIKLDEWGGLPMDDPATCEVFLNEHLVDPLNIPADRFISWISNP